MIIMIVILSNFWFAVMKWWWWEKFLDLKEEEEEDDLNDYLTMKTTKMIMMGWELKEEWAEKRRIIIIMKGKEAESGIINKHCAWRKEREKKNFGEGVRLES